ncbi:MAG: glutathionylspermidine synthase family protein [Clostridia bacterium]
MKRLSVTPRENYKAKIEELGFQFHTDYWEEKACYSFSNEEIDEIHNASEELYKLYCLAAEHVIQNELWEELCIPEHMVKAIVDSWNEDDLSLYGRFDFVFKNGVPKLLEFNADTPTSLFEAAVVQWQWKEEVFPSKDQYNNMHEYLVRSWSDIHKCYGEKHYHFACLMDNLEDATTTSYIMSTASEAKLNTTLMDMEDIVLVEKEDGSKSFCTPDNESINAMFKLYPWEWMMNEGFGESIKDVEMSWIEPTWKLLFSNKAMLPLLYKLFPDCKYLLPCYLEEDARLLGNYCKKPIFSREGANIQLVKNYKVDEESFGDYGHEGHIYQELVDIESFDGWHPVIGSWIIGGEAAGIGIRETISKITHNMSNFAPHIIE